MKLKYMGLAQFHLINSTKHSPYGPSTLIFFRFLCISPIPLQAKDRSRILIYEVSNGIIISIHIWIAHAILANGDIDRFKTPGGSAELGR
jgi:hypothetical protein